MMMFGRAIKTISSRMSILKVEDSRCTRNRSRLSKCSECMDICPVDVISIGNNKIHIGEECIECGLCAGVCPTDSIMIQEPTENNLYDYIEKQSKASSDLILTCNKNLKLSKNAFKVPCLGSLSLEFLIGVGILPLNVNVIFKDETCMKCEAGKGISIYLENLEKAKGVIDLLEIGPISIKNLERIPKIKKTSSKELEVDEERRLFLTSIFKTTKNLPNLAIKELLGDGNKNRQSKEIVSSPMFKKHKILSKVSEDLIEKGRQDREIEYYLKPSIEDNCNLCGACSTLCPMGALRLKEGEKGKGLYLREELCSGCRLCKDICYHKAIVMKNKNLYDFSKGEECLLFQEKDK